MRRIGLIVLAVPVVAALLGGCAYLAFIAIPAWILLARGWTFDSPPVSPPLEHVSVTRHHGQATEIHAVLVPGVPLADAVNLDAFEGVDRLMTPEAAARRIGPPSGVWRVPPTSAGHRTSVDRDAPFYERPWGRLTLRPTPAVEPAVVWIPVAYPRPCSLEYLFRDARLRTQVRAWLPSERDASLSLRSASGGSIFVSLRRDGCHDVELLLRDPR